MSEAGKVSLPVTVARLPEEAIAELDERIGEIWNKEAGDFEEDTELISDDMMGNFNLLTIGYDAAWTEVERLSAALEEAQRSGETALRSHYYVEEKLKEAQQALVVKEDTIQFLDRSLSEAQQTIARLEAENKRLGSLVPIVKEATELMSWRDPGGGKGQAEALQLIYRWALENPSPEYKETQALGEGVEEAKSPDGLLIAHHCLECGFNGEVRSNVQKVRCPECKALNDVWIEGQPAPSNHGEGAKES